MAGNTIAAVQFQHKYDKQEWNEKEYHYKTFLTDLKEGDLVVVETTYGPTVAKFIKYVAKAQVNSLKFIVQKVDTEAFEEAKERHKKKADLIETIEQRAAELRKLKELESLASQDDELKALLDELKKLY